MSTDNVVPIGGSTVLPIPPDQVLETAKEKLSEVLILGWTHDDELYVSSSTSHRGEIFFLLEMSKDFLKYDV